MANKLNTAGQHQLNVDNGEITGQDLPIARTWTPIPTLRKPGSCEETLSVMSRATTCHDIAAMEIFLDKLRSKTAATPRPFLVERSGDGLLN